MTLDQAMMQATEDLGGDPIVINGGECGDWAELVCEYFPAANMNTCQYKEDNGHHECFHAYVIYNGLLFDAETPNGVEHWSEFPAVIRNTPSC